MNEIMRLEFELVYCDVAVQHVIHNATGTPPHEMSHKTKTNKKQKNNKRFNDRSCCDSRHELVNNREINWKESDFFFFLSVSVSRSLSLCLCLIDNVHSPPPFTFKDQTIPSALSLFIHNKKPRVTHL